MLFFEHWNNFEEIAYKNKNTSLAEKVAILTPHVEIIHVIYKSLSFYFVVFIKVIAIKSEVYFTTTVLSSK